MKPILVLLALAVALSAQEKSVFERRYISQNQLNCRWFNDLTLESRVTYVAGFFDGVATVTHNPLFIQATHSHLDVVAGIKEICSAPENVAIRLIDAYAAFVAKATGARDADIADSLAAARTYATYGIRAPAPNPPPKKDESKK